MSEGSNYNVTNRWEIASRSSGRKRRRALLDLVDKAEQDSHPTEANDEQPEVHAVEAEQRDEPIPSTAPENPDETPNPFSVAQKWLYSRSSRRKTSFRRGASHEPVIIPSLLSETHPPPSATPISPSSPSAIPRSPTPFEERQTADRPHEEIEQEVYASEETDRKEAEHKEAERKEAERKEAERKEAERKEAERKEADRRAAVRICEEAEHEEAKLQAAIRKREEGEAERQRSIPSSPVFPDFIPFKKSTLRSVVAEGVSFTTFAKHVDELISRVALSFTAEREKMERNGTVHSNNLFSDSATSFTKWSSALLLETAASLLRDCSTICSRSREDEMPYELLACKDIESGSGIFMQIFRRFVDNVPRQKVLRYLDCFLFHSLDDIITLSLCIADESRYSLPSSSYNLVPAIVLHRFDVRDLSISLYPNDIHYVTTIRNDLRKVQSMRVVTNPSNRFEETLATICGENTQAKIRLHDALLTQYDIRYQSERSAQSQQAALFFGKRSPYDYNKLIYWYSNRTYDYISSLVQHRILNQAQSNAVHNGLRGTVEWEKNSENLSDLSRFFMVHGVPGCGKTSTIVAFASAFVVHYCPSFLARMTRDDASLEVHGHILVAAKTNKALDVICDRMKSVPMLTKKEGNVMCSRSLPFYCSRSSSYQKGVGIPAHRLPRGNPSAPIILSTFGNLPNLINQLRRPFYNSYSNKYFQLPLKSIVIDEGSQVGAEELFYFLELFPSFDGTVIIFGDENQLGPVILSTWKQVRQYLSKSVLSWFIHGQRNLAETTFLNVQYRMHQDIMTLANDVAYEGFMVAGPGSPGSPETSSQLQFPKTISNAQKGREEARLNLSPVVFVSTSNETDPIFKCEGETNWGEIKVAMAYINVLCVRHPPIAHCQNVVFLTPYLEQMKAMSSVLATHRLPVESHTVTSYQGEENTIVIFSPVRTAGRGVGFANDNSMISVAITRPKNSLIIIGDIEHLVRSGDGNSVWARIRQSINKRGFPTHSPADIYPATTASFREFTSRLHDTI